MESVCLSVCPNNILKDRNKGFQREMLLVENCTVLFYDLLRSAGQKQVTSLNFLSVEMILVEKS